MITPPPSIKPATTTVDLDAFKLKCVDLPGNDTYVACSRCSHAPSSNHQRV